MKNLTFNAANWDNQTWLVLRSDQNGNYIGEVTMRYGRAIFEPNQSELYDTRFTAEELGEIAGFCDEANKSA